MRISSKSLGKRRFGRRWAEPRPGSCAKEQMSDMKKVRAKHAPYGILGLREATQPDRDQFAGC